jgi:hypothetical protein
MWHETMALLRENIGVWWNDVGMSEKKGEKINVEENFEVDLHGWCIEHLLTAN